MASSVANDKFISKLCLFYRFFLPLLTLCSTFSLFNYGKNSKPIALYFKIKILGPQVTPISRRAAHTFLLPRSSLLRNKIESILLCKPHANKQDIWPNAIFRTKLLLFCHQNNFWQSNLHFQHDSCHVRRPFFTRPWQWLQPQPETFKLLCALHSSCLCLPPLLLFILSSLLRFLASTVGVFCHYSEPHRGVSERMVHSDILPEWESEACCNRGLYKLFNILALVLLAIKFR